jgi:hypothetical protein
VSGAPRVPSRELGRILGRELDAWRREARAELGLPTDRFIVMTGHQAGIWHAGIAEKFVVGARIAAERGGVLVHVVVDHDLNDASLVAYPAVVRGRLERLALERSPRGTPGAPNALRRPVRTMRSERAHEVPAEIEPALEAIERAMQAERGRENLAMQMAHAANALLAPTVRVDHTVAATALATTAFARAMRAHFAPLRDAYNAAIAGERIAPLAARELPFWSLDRRAAARRPLFEDDSPEAVAPRALALTAIARLVLCDVFIHGTGGARYDLAMERWIRAAFGEEAHAALAPMSVATATRLAPLARFVPEFDARATPEALRALEQDPFDDDGRTKRALLDSIRGEHAAKRAAFVAMRRKIIETRSARAEEIASLRARISANAEARRVHALAADRTWPFPLAAC